jgi:hypothetical protein
LGKKFRSLLESIPPTNDAETARQIPQQDVLGNGKVLAKGWSLVDDDYAVPLSVSRVGEPNRFSVKQNEAIIWWKDTARNLD